MIICHDPKFVYYAPPKTGTKSLGTIFMDRGWIEGQGGKHHIETDLPIQQLQRSGYFFFITVRNPYARTVSLWKHFQKKTFPKGKWPPGRKELYDDLQGKGFGHFVLSDWTKHSHHIAQGLWHQYFYFQAMPECDKVVRMESFEQDVRSLPFLPDDQKIPHENLRILAPWQKYYEDKDGEELAARVYLTYAPDFDYFNYAEDSWKPCSTS
jgi:hypothetical protein